MNARTDAWADGDDGVTPLQQHQPYTAKEQTQLAVLRPSQVRCVVCRHPSRAAIEAEYLTTNAGLPKIAARYGVSYASLWRHHGRNHHANLLADAIKEEDDQLTLLGRLKEFLTDVEGVFIEERGKPACQLCLRSPGNEMALKAMDRLTRLCDLLGQASGELKKHSTTVNVLVAPEAAARMIGAADDLELADELERRARLLRERWAENHPALAAVDAEWSETAQEPVYGLLTDPTEEPD